MRLLLPSQHNCAGSSCRICDQDRIAEAAVRRYLSRHGVSDGFGARPNSGFEVFTKST